MADARFHRLPDHLIKHIVSFASADDRVVRILAEVCQAFRGLPAESRMWTVFLGELGALELLEQKGRKHEIVTLRASKNVWSAGFSGRWPAGMQEIRFELGSNLASIARFLPLLHKAESLHRVTIDAVAQVHIDNSDQLVHAFKRFPRDRITSLTLKLSGMDRPQRGQVMWGYLLLNKLAGMQNLEHLTWIVEGVSVSGPDVPQVAHVLSTLRSPKLHTLETNQAGVGGVGFLPQRDIRRVVLHENKTQVAFLDALLDAFPSCESFVVKGMRVAARGLSVIGLIDKFKKHPGHKNLVAAAYISSQTLPATSLGNWLAAFPEWKWPGAAFPSRLLQYKSVEDIKYEDRADRKMLLGDVAWRFACTPDVTPAELARLINEILSRYAGESVVVRISIISDSDVMIRALAMERTGRFVRWYLQTDPGDTNAVAIAWSDLVRAGGKSLAMGVVKVW